MATNWDEKLLENEVYQATDKRKRRQYVEPFRSFPRQTKMVSNWAENFQAEPRNEMRKRKTPRGEEGQKWIFSLSCHKRSLLIIILLLGITIYFYFFCRYHQSASNINLKLTMETEIARLKREFPAQLKDTWKNILGIFTKEGDVAKSIFLLHRNDTSTCNNLIDELAFIYKKNKNFEKNEVIFESDARSMKDYGELLEHYRASVKKHGVLVTDLNQVPGNLAGIFHFLSDESHSLENAPLLIFALKDENYTDTDKPLRRATHVLKSVWKELPENEIYPLMSRIVKNVIFVMPENEQNFAEHHKRE